MELLIPGLILVALMVWASTKIKKTAADAFQAESIQTGSYSLEKPEGFLHVIGDPDHELSAYSRDFGKNDNAGIRQATIELDVFPSMDVAEVRRLIEEAATDVRPQRADVLETDETANEIDVKAFYKIVAAEDAVYRLRFAVLPEHSEDYLRKIEKTLDSFIVHTN